MERQQSNHEKIKNLVHWWKVKKIQYNYFLERIYAAKIILFPVQNYNLKKENKLIPLKCFTSS